MSGDYSGPESEGQCCITGLSEDGMGMLFNPASPLAITFPVLLYGV
jgi:hypothetical protein